jgi:hypothetical protein
LEDTTIAAHRVAPLHQAGLPNRLWRHGVVAPNREPAANQASWTRLATRDSPGRLQPSHAGTCRAVGRVLESAPTARSPTDCVSSCFYKGC